MKLQIGLEAEAFLVDNEDKLVIVPRSIARDDFPLLVEFRADPGKTVGEAVGNFTKCFIDLSRKIEVEFKNKYRVKIAPYQDVSMELFRAAMKEGGIKHLPTWENIYGINTDAIMDSIMERRKIVGRRVSAGLHIHFSAEEFQERTEYEYNVTTVGSEILYRRTGKNVYNTRVASYLDSTLMLKHIVKQMDDRVFHTYVDKDLRKLCKYRQPGFYERKPWGFEWRSLPFSDVVNADLINITATAFEVLEGSIK